MGTYYYGVIAEIRKANGDVVMYVGKNLYEPPEEIVSRCKNILRKIRSLRGKPNWYCSTLRQINEILELADSCPTNVLLYLLIAEELGIEPEIVSEYDRGYEDGRSYFDVRYSSEIDEVCEKLFEGKKHRSGGNRRFRED